MEIVKEKAEELAARATRHQAHVESLITEGLPDTQMGQLGGVVSLYQALRTYLVPIVWSSTCWLRGLTAYQNLSELTPLLLVLVAEFLSLKRAEEAARAAMEQRGFTWRKVMVETGQPECPATLAKLLRANLHSCASVTTSLRALAVKVTNALELGARVWAEYSHLTSPAIMLNCPEELQSLLPSKTQGVFTMLTSHYLCSGSGIDHLTMREVDMTFFADAEENREMLDRWKRIGLLRLFRQTCARAWRSITRSAVIQVKPGPNGVMGVSYQGARMILESIKGEVDAMLVDNTTNHWRISGNALLAEVDAVLLELQAKTASTVKSHEEAMAAEADVDLSLIHI